MFSKSYKSKVAMFGSAALALTISASSQAVATLVANGDFEAGNANWGTFEAATGDTSFEVSGGNGGGFGFVTNNSGGWGGGFVHSNDPVALSDYGLSGGDTTTFTFDMKDYVLGDGNPNPCQAGVESYCTGIKLESWTATAGISNTGDIQFDALDTNWNTYSQGYTFDPSATHFKVVLVGVRAGQVGFDNLTIDAAAVVPVPAAAWLFGSALAGLVAVRRKK